MEVLFLVYPIDFNQVFGPDILPCDNSVIVRSCTSVYSHSIVEGGLEVTS